MNAVFSHYDSGDAAIVIMPTQLLQINGTLLAGLMIIFDEQEQRHLSSILYYKHQVDHGFGDS
jgi:hypothetical protein